MDPNTPEMPEEEPELIISRLCTYVPGENDGPGVKIDIYTVEGKEDQWTLEMVNDRNTSFVFDDVFATDREALNAALDALEEEGMEAFYSEGDRP